MVPRTPAERRGLVTRLTLLLVISVTLGGCAWIGLEVTNAPRIPDCPAGRANCR